MSIEDEPSLPPLVRRRLTDLGLLVALITLVLDQASKYWILYILELPSLLLYEVMPVMDFVMAWNKGISYGLFAQHSDWGQWLLIGISSLALLVLWRWLEKAETRPMATSLGLIMGGAMGNAIDRSLYGAVVDFISLHAFGYSWYIFNIADVAIVLGAIGLLYETIRKPAATPSP